MADEIKQVKEKFAELKKIVNDLNVEVKEWEFDMAKTEAGTTIKASMTLLVPKKK
jgi:hypothetical protein